LAISAACKKVKKAFKFFGTIKIKIPFVELYEECTICVILRVNIPISLAATQAKNMLGNAAQCCGEAQK